MTLEREVGEIHATVTSIDKKLDRIVLRNDRLEDRVRGVERRQYSIMALIAGTGAAVGAALKGALDKVIL